MTIPEIDAELAKLATSLESTCRELDQHRDAFLNAVAPFIQDWFSSYTKQHVISEPEIAKKLGTAGPGTLKAAAQSLGSSAPTRVHALMTGDTEWVYQKASPSEKDLEWGEYLISGTSVPSKLDTPLRRILGALRGPLRDAGFLTNFHWESEYQSGRPSDRFTGPLTWSEPMITAMKAFDTAYQGFSSLTKKRRSLERQRAEIVAMDLWDKA